MLSCAACRQHPVPGPSPRPSDKSLWEMENDPVESVSVFCGNTLVQTFFYEYDDCSRLIRIRREDAAPKSVMFDLKLDYEGLAGMRLSGSYLYAFRTIGASFSEDGDVLRYGPEGGDGMSCTLTMDSGDLPAMCRVAYSYECPEYSSDVRQRIVYTAEDGDITAIAITTESAFASKCLTKAVSGSGIEYVYTYCDKPDLQNFAAYLVPCEFPVWVAAELPGCSHLISGMTCRCGGVTLPESYDVTYVLNDNGSIRSAVRTDFSRGTKVSELRYEFSYL